MRTSHHPNLVHYIDSYIDRDSRLRALWVVSEAMDCGHLADRYRYGRPKEAYIAYVCREVCTSSSNTQTHLTPSHNT